MAKNKSEQNEKTSEQNLQEQVIEAAYDVLSAGRASGLFENLSPEELEKRVTEELRALKPQSKIEEIIKYEGVNFRPVIEKNARYDDSSKMLSIIYMQSFQHDYINDRTGEIKILPRFTYLSGILQIPKGTLHRWWQDRENILKKDSLLRREGLNIAVSNFMVGLLKMSNQVANLDYSTLIGSGEPRDMTNFIKLIDVIVSKIRLIQNLSTENVAHRHEHTGAVAYVLPDEKSQPPKKNIRNGVSTNE